MLGEANQAPITAELHLHSSTMAQIDNNIQEISAALQVFSQRLPPTLVDLRNEGGAPAGINQQLQELREVMVQGFADVQATIAYHSRLSHIRSLNACATKRASPIHPLPLPNGGYPPPGVFPAFVKDFDNLDGPGLTALLQLYELPHQNLVAQRRSTLAEYFNIPR
ncbi:unnamed protein product [Rhizoctonia solani]|uniref:Uncharacterized protein n=1 Tax=Rhizoctonia solani TaxID=456999 RepID=A0A8H3HGM7_9AGAM|nr:unnamed protein product [Rhizoctonia solani]